ncbi:MAG: peptide ABC transporter ATP-binding protein [Rhizobiales bacterium 65-79]|jgi:peptide/nickel transport system ATP-binding protein|nr:ATP-binding cassette domain-containing protein [Hyphomicrobiales bacterium]OJU05796.1 MAG: peptide ABC transporter ATP-binding protein [Rhizobiales bacterium 65-79]
MAIPEHRDADISSGSAEQFVIELCGVSRSFGGPGALERLGLGRGSPVIHAVRDVSFGLRQGEVLGIVGESGCGKSTLARMVAGILKPTAGEIRWHGKPLSSLRGREGKAARLKAQMVFQNPWSAMNPRLRAAEIVAEAPRIHGLIPRGEQDAYVAHHFLLAGLDPALGDRYPHQLSGGQRQRLVIARALAVVPEMLVCDEAVAALDVSIQAQILNMLMDLREKLDLTSMFISHDLGVIEHLSDRVVVMYLGRVVENAEVAELFERPNHPYTRALLEELPRIDGERRPFAAIEGELPSPLNPPPGCAFHPRCPFAMERCRREAPALLPVASGHLSACHLNDMA